MNAYHGRLKIIGGKLEHASQKDAILYEQFKRNLKEGVYMDYYIEEHGDDATLAQLAKVHKMIRVLANYTGNDFEDMKLLVKERAGLCIEKKVSGRDYFVCRSFGDCSYEELSLAIQACIRIGEQVGCPLQ